MKNVIYLCLLLASAVCPSVGTASAFSGSAENAQVRSAPSTRAEIGFPAPDFTLDAVVNQEFKKISLSDYHGKWLVLFFYPGDFTFVCPTEIKGFNKALADFAKD